MNMEWIKNHTETAYSETIIRELTAITDSPETGGRFAGSPAEHRAADYLVKKFRETGLKNVTKDPCPTDTWIFRHARMTYQGRDGAEKTIRLGEYACDAHFDHEEVRMIFAGRGTERDYADIDPAGKLVLIEIDQANDWWINFPAYEAKRRGAIGVICINTGGFGQVGENVLVSQDMCGPAETLAFSVGKRDGGELKGLIADSEEKEIAVTLDIDSTVHPGGVTYNVWGDIPGKSDEVIYVINHYDSYYHTVFDDVQGIGWALGLAKAFITNGYTPEKTIRIVAHGAEEWGIIDCKYDWAAGAYRQIMDVRPEWKDTGFAVVNLDGFYAVKGEHKFCIVCTRELYDFVRDAVSSYGDTGEYEIEVNMKLTSTTEDFGYTKVGIPSFVAGAYDGCLADRKVLHASNSDWDSGFDHEAFDLFHRLFAHIIVELDRMEICPLNLERRLTLARESLPEDTDDKIKAAFDTAAEEARRLNMNLRDRNAKLSPKALTAAETKAIDREMHQSYRYLHNHFIRLNWNDEMITPHERYIANLDTLAAAGEKIQAGDHAAAADELAAIDFNYYALYFSEETYDYFEKQLTETDKIGWGTGLVEHGNENLYDVIRALKNGSFDRGTRQALDDAAARQKEYLTRAVREEAEAAVAITELLKELNGRFDQQVGVK